MTKEELEIDNKRLDFNEKVQLIVKKEELKEQDIRLNKLCFDYHEKEKRIAELEAQIEKLIDFTMERTECCDVCPITDTCINSEGTCSYAGILAKGEEEVTREWIMQFISNFI